MNKEGCPQPTAQVQFPNFAICIVLESSKFAKRNKFE